MRVQFMELAQQGVKLLGRHGAGGNRLLEPLVAAEASAVHVLSSEFDDAEGHGVFIDPLHEDAEFESHAARASAADGRGASFRACSPARCRSATTVPPSAA